MANGVVRVPVPVNEPVRNYAPGSPERASLKSRLNEMLGEQVDMPLIIGGREVRTETTAKAVCPFDHKHVLGNFHQAGTMEVEAAIESSQKAWRDWAHMDWESRAAVFLKAADLLAGPWRDTMNAATMLNQAKTAHQAEIDAACEMIDFLRFNVHYMRFIYEQQPDSAPGLWNQLEYRALEGFIFAVTPFNFSSIGGNLPTAPAMMGNVVLWKPASTAVLYGHYFMQLLREAGLPDGVINFIPGRASEIGDAVFESPRFAGVHFTGSTRVFQSMWKTIGERIESYSGYPRIVGETGGKDFVFAHQSADVEALVTALVRGAFEYQGQKCSAASRAYIPSSIWPEVRSGLESMIAQIKIGPVTDFRNFMSAVIDEKAFDSITSYIASAVESDQAEVIIGGKSDKSEGFYIDPTVILTRDPHFKTICEEIFGPVLTIFVYDDDKLEETLDLCDTASPYGLTGAIFARDRQAIVHLGHRLRHTAGNFYINDKPTGAVVGQQPFGGSRASGTNDKAGSYLNLIRWTSARSIKETFTPAKGFAYPFMGDE
ncbi:MAG: L-glutamate gamma-semialdehyde dehydrogenase [Acidobacteriota bacterium]